VIGWVEHPLVKALLPVPMLVAIAPLIYWFFIPTWRKLEEDALAYRRELAADNRVDFRPLVTLTLGALILTVHEYYGSMAFFNETVKPALARMSFFAGDPDRRAHLSLYTELYGRVWWGGGRFAGYVLPFVVWPLFFRKDSLLDMGLRFSGLREHAWLYALFVVIMIPIMLLVARQPDFGAYYPFCATAGRSWADFLAWEVIYLAQFVGLEMFFRGWWLRTTRVFGTGAIFSMIVPYCMIHFGKPYLEACSALIAGVVLGSLAMKTRSIWAGVAVHVTVAVLMDVLALDRKGKLPSALTAGSSQHLHFLHWRALIWAVWGLALLVLVVKAVRARHALRAAWLRWRMRA
jgi:membrane protease YdiL (CAAX protease family)